MVIIFVFTIPRNEIIDSLKFEIVHGLGTIAEYNIFILGALQAEKLTTTSGACFAGHPVSSLMIFFVFTAM